MSENESRPNEPRKLSEEEMSQVHGGDQSWDSTLEEIWQEKYGRPLRDDHDSRFEKFLRSQHGDELVMARNLWLDAGKPNNWVYIYYSDGHTDLWRK